MKKQILSFLFLFAGASLFSQEADPVIMLINNKEIRKSDFEYLYKKNNAYQQQSDEKLSDYKDLFINLKLKVEEKTTATKVDESIIGGFILQLDNQRMDASVKGQLRQIKAELMR